MLDFILLLYAGLGSPGGHAQDGVEGEREPGLRLLL